MYFVYILESAEDRKLYTGCTSDLSKRLKAHNSGKVKSTQKRRPLKLIYSEKADTFVQARRRENELKSLKGGLAKRELISQVAARP